MTSWFENASGIDIPDQICGVDLPDPNVGGLIELAADVAGTLGGLGDIVEKAAKVREILANGSKAAGNCYAVAERGSDVIERIANNMAPIEALFYPLERTAEAMSLCTKENLDVAVQVILDVLDLSKLLDKIMSLIRGVGEVFGNITEFVGDIVDSVMAFFSDLANQFAEALGLEGALSGVEDMFADIKWVIGELGDLGGTLKPLLDQWADASSSGFGAFGAMLGGVTAAGYVHEHWDEIADALSRFMPCWDRCKELLGLALQYGFSAFEMARKAWSVGAKVVKQLAGHLGLPVPGGFGADPGDSQPEMRAARMPEIEEESDDGSGRRPCGRPGSGEGGWSRGGRQHQRHESPDRRSESGESGGGRRRHRDDSPDRTNESQEFAKMRRMFHAHKDRPKGMSYDAFRDVLDCLGLDEGEIRGMIRETDKDRNGIIDVDEFINWVSGDSICDEDREILDQELGG